MSRFALIPHPQAFRGALDYELVDERLAFRFAAAYEDGCYKAIERVFDPCRESWKADSAWRAMDALHRRYAPTYSEVRDYLIGECNVPLVLAARIALRLTRKAIS